MAPCSVSGCLLFLNLSILRQRLELLSWQQAGFLILGNFESTCCSNKQEKKIRAVLCGCGHRVWCHQGACHTCRGNRVMKLLPECLHAYTSCSVTTTDSVYQGSEWAGALGPWRTCRNLLGPFLFGSALGQMLFEDISTNVGFLFMRHLRGCSFFFS